MALSKEFYLDEIRSKYPNSYNESLKDLPVKDLENMLDFLDGALGKIERKRKEFESKADGGRIGFDIGGSVIEKVASFFFDDEGNASKALQRAKFELSEFIAGKGTDLRTGAEWYNKLEPEEQREIIEEKIKYRERGELGGVPVYDEKYAGKFGIGGNYADGGSIGIEVLFKEKMANGGRVPALSGGFLKILAEGADRGKQGIMELVESGKSLFSKGDDALDLAKQEEIFRSGNITTEFLENVDDKVLNKFLRTRDTKGPGGYGMYESFDDMPNGLKAAELISRIRSADGGIDYEAAEIFIGKKLKGDETVNELIKMVITEKKADGGRVGLFMGGPALEGQALDIYTSMNKYGFSDQEIANALRAQGLYDAAPAVETPVTNTATNIINQQTGGDGPSTPPGPTFNRNDLLGTSDYFPNPPLGHSLKMGLGSIVDFIKSGGIIGNTIKSFAKKFQKPRVELVNKINFDAVVREQQRQEAERKAAFEQAARDRETYRELEDRITRGEGRGDNEGPSTGATAAGAGMGVGGGYASDYGFKKGGLATMFTRRR